jgi:hypothetical protein
VAIMTETDDEYDILYPDPQGTDILNDSDHVTQWLPPIGCSNDAIMELSARQPVQVCVSMVSTLIRRVTYCRFNWETETLRSFLEVLTWTSVTAVTYSIHSDWLWAVQMGFSVGLVMSVCDEVCFTGARSLYQWIMTQHPSGVEFLYQCGFDVALPRSAKRYKSNIITCSSDDISLIKTVVFGALSLESLRHVYLASTQDVQRFALLSTVMGVAFVIMGELFCLWLPTRRLGLTVQSRWTKIPLNWRAHFTRSLFEVSCWTLCLLYVYWSTASIGTAILWSSLLGILLCLVNGIDEATPCRAATLETHFYISPYWDQWATGSISLDAAHVLARIIKH